ncbi:hypothetical protein MMC21_002990 [Puttea exsequens]|nr:hypothetical protein [Puttea exsequens]
MAVNPAAIARGKEALTHFTHLNVPYQTINDHAITTDILIPKDIKPGKAPLIVRFHGGFLITGESMFLGFFPPWILEYALKNSAVLVSPNYLKLPESDGLAIMDNLFHFWTWLNAHLNSTVSNATNGEVEIDGSNKLIIGHSAGGYLAVQSALTQPPKSFSALILAYPMLDLSSPFFSTSYEKYPFGRPMLDKSVVDGYLSAKKKGEVVSAVAPPKRLDLAVAAVQHGIYPTLLGPSPSLYPLNTLTSTLTSSSPPSHILPPLFIFHGTSDSAVACAGTEAFVAKAKEVLSDADFDKQVLVKLENGDHGFDTMASFEGEKGNGWLREGLEWVGGWWGV